MSVEKLKRVCQRLRIIRKDTRVTREEIAKAVMIECGTSPKTITNNRKALIRLGWLRTHKTKWELTDKDLTEDY